MKNFTNAEIVTTDSDPQLLFSTSRFNIMLSDQQIVPGMLSITMRLNNLNSWENWQDEDWLELIQVARTCEFLLIETFDYRDPKVLPSLDDKLINFAGKQRLDVNDNFQIKFDIVPRYRGATFIEDDSGQKYLFEDILFGKPFDMSQECSISPECAKRIFDKLQTVLRNIDFTKFLLEDSFKSWDSCIACRPSDQHPMKAGLAEVAGFRLALDSKSQEEPGRVFCDTGKHGHIPAPRYWEDEWMVGLGKIFKAYKHTEENVYPATGRMYDIMCLMNLAKLPEGTHTHWHFIPRTPGGKNFNEDFSMNPKTYVPIPPESICEIVYNFQQPLVQNLIGENLEVEWPSQAE